MKYIKGLLYYFLFSLIAILVVYLFFPNLIEFFRIEDQGIQNLSVLVFFVSGLIALFYLPRVKQFKPVVGFAAFLGFLGALDELSFGERIFSLQMPYLAGKKIDGAHDLVGALAKWLYQGIKYSPEIFIPFLVILFVLSLVLLYKYFNKLAAFITPMLKSPSHWLIVITFLFIAAAILIDFKLVEHEILYMYEEIFELNAAVSLGLVGPAALAELAQLSHTLKLI